ncbi:hypothetical protein WJX77_001792 [Trebouxia sp. C0004]
MFVFDDGPDVLTGLSSDTESTLSLHPCLSESDVSDEDHASRDEATEASLSAFARLKSLLHQRDVQLRVDQQETAPPAVRAEASEDQLLTDELELSQYKDWSIKATDPAGQSDSLPYNASILLVGYDQASTAAAEHHTQTQESAIADSPAKLLQIQAQDAADRAVQRQKKQQRVLLLQQTLAKQQYAAGCIQRAWRTYHSSPYRAHKLAAVVRLQAGVRAFAARQHASYLRHQQSATAAMESAMLSGSRSQLQAAAAQLVQAGLSQLSHASVRSFEQKASTAVIQLKQVAQGGNGAQWQEAAQHAQRFEHLSGDVAEAQDVFMARQKEAEAAVVAALRDESLERVQSLIAKAALLNVDQQRLSQALQACVNRDKSAVSGLQAALQAEPFSIDIFRLRLLDARRLGLNTETHSAQGDLEVRRQTMARQLQQSAVHAAAADVQDLSLSARQLGLLGEAVAAEQLLAERQSQASHTLTAAADTGSAADYATAVAVAQAAAVQAAIMTSAAAAMTTRCRAAAEWVTSAARDGSWREFASVRQQAIFLGLCIQEAETLIQNRRAAAARTVSEAVTACLNHCTLESIKSELTAAGLAHSAQDDSSLDMPCAACTNCPMKQHHPAATTAVQPPVQSNKLVRQTVHNLFLRAGASQVDSSLYDTQQALALNAQALTLITRALQAADVNVDDELSARPGSGETPEREGQSGLQSRPQSHTVSQIPLQPPSQSHTQSQTQSQTRQPTWQHCMSALSGIISRQHMSLSQSRSRQASPLGKPAQPVPTDGYTDIAAALTAARELGLLHTVKLALHTVQTHLEMQMHEQQAVMAEYNLPTAEHPKDCTAAWHNGPSSEQRLWQNAGAHEQTSTEDSCGHWHDVSHVGQKHIAGPESLQQEGKLVQQLTAKLQKVKQSGAFRNVSAMVVPIGHTREHIKVNLAEWISRSHGAAPSQAVLMPHSGCMAADFSLEKLSGFGDLLQHGTGLVRLEATGNDLTSLAGLETCVGLTHLRLNQNRIESLHQVQHLSNLRGLYLADNHIAEFPDMTPLCQLHTLELARNRLNSLGPRSVSSDSLCCLDLSHNRLTGLTQLQHLPHLRELTVSDNQLTSLEGLQACPLLLGLAAQHNKITAFPAVLACLLLRMLNLNGNRIRSVLETPWLPHLIHLKLQDNLITHMGPLPGLPFLQTLDLSFNHISKLGVVQTLASFQHLRSLRVNDNPVQHEPHFYFSLQRLMPWTQHEFGHARHFPDDQQIRVIQQEAVLKSPEVVQACLQRPLQASCNSPAFSDAFGPVRVPEIDMASARDGVGHTRVGDAARDANENQARDANHDRAVLSRSAGTAALRLSQHDLMMLEGAARRVRCGQGQEAWDRQAIFNLVSRQSVQLSQLTHLLHWRPAFPLTHTSPAFWHKLLPSLASSHLLDDAELQLVRALADVASLRNAVVEGADFAELAGLWDQRFRRYFQIQLQQPPCVHQAKLEGSALYPQQQAGIAAAAARCIQAVWRGRLARRSTASLRAVLQQQRRLHRAATAVQAAWRGHAVREQALLHIRRQAAASQEAIKQNAATKIQAVVRGGKLRQQLSQARQAAAYTDDTLRPDSHDPDLDMEDMNEFLASLPDDEPSPAQSVTSTSSPILLHTPGSTLAGGAIPPAPHQVLLSSQLADARRSSHASASTSGGRQTSSSSLSLYHHAASLPVEFPHSRRGHTAASVAVNISGAVRESPQRSHSTSAWSPHFSVGTVTQTVHRSLSAAETPGSTGAFTHRPPGQQTCSGKSSRHGSQQQHQQEPFLPVLTGSHGAAQMHMASVPGHAIVNTTNTGLRISLPPIQESPNERSTGLVDPNSASRDSGLAAATATAVGGSEEDSQEAARGSSGRSARVSRANSTVRSEHSVSSWSPDKAAAKQERHKAMIQQLMQEWKVGDFAVAESIFKSRQRQLKQKGGAQMRQKMQDPEVRLARLKSQLGSQAPNSRAASVPRHPCNRDPIHMRQAALPEPSLETGLLGSLSTDGTMQQLLDSEQQQR